MSNNKTSSFDSLSAVEQQRIKLEEVQMKKRVAEEKKKKELEAKAKEERLKQQRESKANVSSTQSSITKSKANENRKSTLPPTNSNNSTKRPSSVVKPLSNQLINQQEKGQNIIKSKEGPTSSLKRIISFDDIQLEREKQEIEEQQKGNKKNEIKNAYHNIPVQEHAKEKLDIKEQYMMQLQIQEQMKKIQKTQQLKQQQVKQQNMIAKQQVIEELLNQANQASPVRGKIVNNLVDIKGQQKGKQYEIKQELNQGRNYNEGRKEYEQEHIQSQEDLNDTIDYNMNNQEEDDENDQQNDQEKQNYHSQINTNQQIENNFYTATSNNSANQIVYAVDSLNALPPMRMSQQSLQSMNKINSNDINRSIKSMVQSQNYVGQGEQNDCSDKNTRETYNQSNLNQSSNKSPLRQQILKQTAQRDFQQSNLEKDRGIKYESQVKDQNRVKDENRMQDKSIVNGSISKNISSKTEYENFSVQGKKPHQDNISIQISEVNKSVRDKVFEDELIMNEVDYSESIQVDQSAPLFNKSSSQIQNGQISALRQSVKKSKTCIDMNDDDDFQQQQQIYKQKDKEEPKQSHSRTSTKNIYTTSSPCIQDTSDRSHQASGEQNNSSQFSKNLSRMSSDSQNFNKNLSHTSSGSQRFIKSSGQHERFPIFNKGSQIKDDSDNETKKKSSKNLSEKSLNSNKQSISDRQEANKEYFEEQSDEDGDEAIPIDQKKFQTFKAQPVMLHGSYHEKLDNYEEQEEEEEEEELKEQISGDEEGDNNEQFDKSDDRLQQTEFEEIGKDIFSMKKKSQLMQDQMQQGNRFKIKRQDQEEQEQEECDLKQLSDYSDQFKESYEDNDELQDKAPVNAKLTQGTQDDEPMVVSFGAQKQKNQYTFGKQNSLDESNKKLKDIQQKDSIEDNTNYQTFGARDSEKLKNISSDHLQKKSSQFKSQTKNSQQSAIEETKKIPFYEKTAQFNDQGNPFKNLKQQVKQVKQMFTLKDEDQKFNASQKRSDLFKDDALSNVKKSKISEKESNTFDRNEKDRDSKNQSSISGKSLKQDINQNKNTSTTRSELINNMRKRKDDNEQISTNDIAKSNMQADNQYDQQSRQSLSNPSVKQNNLSTKQNNPSIKQNSPSPFQIQNISDFQIKSQYDNSNYNTLQNNISDKMSTPTEEQSYQKNSFDMKFQEAYEQQDQFCNSDQMVDESPMQFMKNSPYSLQKSNKQNEPLNQKHDFEKQSSPLSNKQPLQKEKKGWNIPQKNQQEEEQEFWNNKKIDDKKKRKAWETQNSNPKSVQQPYDKYSRFDTNDQLSQSIGQTSDIISNQSNYHSKLQRLHESEEFQDNEFIEPSLKSKIEEESIRDSYSSKGNQNQQPHKLWPTRNINAGGNKGFKYQPNGNQCELERDDEEQEDNYYNQQKYQQNEYDDDDNYDEQDDQDNYEDQDDRDDQQYSEEQNYDDHQQYYQNNNYNRGNNQRNQPNDDDYDNNNEDNDDQDNYRNNYNNNNKHNYDDDEQEEEDQSINGGGDYDQDIQKNNQKEEINENGCGEEQKEQDKQVQKGVAMTIDFGDNDDQDELEKKKKHFEKMRLKKIQEFELNKQKKLQEIQLKQQNQVDEQDSPCKEKNIIHRKQPSSQMAQKQGDKKGNDNIFKSEKNTPTNKQVRKSYDNQSQLGKNQPSTNQKDQIQNYYIPKSPNPPVKGFRLPQINKKKENIDEENKSDLQDNFTPKPSVQDTPTTKPRIPFQKQSNKLIISQAISKVCLAGPNCKERDTALKKIKESQSEHFIVLFKGINGRQDFKGLYTMENMEVKKLYGLNTAPTNIDLNQVQAFYRYDSGSKEFKELQVKAFSSQVDAILLKK